MATITEDYVTFEVARLLKEKGFDEYCLKNYWNSDKELHDWKWELSYNRNSGGNRNTKDCAAPTHQIAMKWLRETYDIFIDIGYDDLDWYWLIESISKDIPYEDRPKLIKNGTACHKTYEEAVEAALKYALENLI